MAFIKWAIKRYVDSFNATYAVIIAIYLLYRVFDTFARYGTLQGRLHVIILPLVLAFIVWSGSALKERVNVLLYVFAIGLVGILFLLILVACRGEFFMLPES